MIRHVVAFRFREDATNGERADLLAELAELPNRFPVLQDFELGRNTSSRDSRFTHAFAARAESMDQLETYLTSEAHERFVAERFRPLVSERAIVSFEVT